MLPIAKTFTRNVCNLLKQSLVPLAHEHFHSKGFEQKDPRTILFLHGFLGLKKNYRSIGKHLSRLGYKVLGVDFRNHGKSHNALPFTYEAMTEDLENYIEKNKLQNLVLVGHSMGAKIAMRYALQNPDRMSSLVVVDNTPSFTPLDESFYENVRLLAHLEKIKFPTDISNHKLYELIRKQLLGLHPHVQTFLLSNVASHEDGYVKFCNPNQCFLEHNVIDTVSLWPEPMISTQQKFNKPVLVIRSKTSGFIPTMKPFERYFEHFEVAEFDTGHYIITEKGPEFLDVLQSHLQAK